MACAEQENDCGHSWQHDRAQTSAAHARRTTCQAAARVPWQPRLQVALAECQWVHRWACRPRRSL